MKVTKVRIRRSLGDNKVKALASVTLDEEMVVHEIRVVEGQNGLFVSFPSRKTTAGKYIDLAHPVTAAARVKIQTAVLDAYGAWLRQKEEREKKDAEEARQSQAVPAPPVPAQSAALAPTEESPARARAEDSPEATPAVPSASEAPVRWEEPSVKDLAAAGPPETSEMPEAEAV